MSSHAIRTIGPFLSRIQQELAVQSDIEFRVLVVGRQQPLQPPIGHEIYRICREALVNAFRHSRAKRVEFELEYAYTDLRMNVRDNGCGIDPRSTQGVRGTGAWPACRSGRRESAGCSRFLVAQQPGRRSSYPFRAVLRSKPYLPITAVRADVAEGSGSNHMSI